MLGLTRLHDIAAARGDGLRPELLDLLRGQQLLLAANVEQIADHLPCHQVQAGPNPTSTTPAANVVAFPASDAARRPRQATARK